MQAQAQPFDTQASELDSRAGVDRDKRKAVASQLATVLADSYLLLIKTQGLHWNIEGPYFYGIHKLTEEQYESLFEAIDDIAERIRALGFPAPAGHAVYGKSSMLEDFPAEATFKDMIDALIRDNEALANAMRECVRVAENADDVKTADLLTDRLGVHEENAWMLRATVATTS